MATPFNPCRTFLLLAASLPSLGRATAQAYTPPPPKLTPGPCVSTKEFPCEPPAGPAGKPATIPAPADKFPFPGSDTAPNPEKPDAKPTAPAQPDSKKPNFAYPGDPDEPAEPSSSSSSRDPSTAADAAAAPDQPPLKDAGSTGSTRFQRKHLAKIEDLDHRELEDLDVSHYYLTTGNFAAAYTRAQDALKLYPDDENAHFALAAAADKLHKRDEAIAEYKLYLQVAPDGTNAKQAKRSLELLQPR